MNSTKIGQISITLKAWEKLAEGLPRDHRGYIRQGALKERVNQIVNTALDSEGART